jgi:hypothetical protein
MKPLVIGSLAVALLTAGSAEAASYVVQAAANSSSGGVGLGTVSLTLGDAFTVSADPNDLWNAGALPRYSDADGLDGPRFATAADDSGQPVGTLIGADFGFWFQNGLSARYGSLVGEIGGVYQVLGTSFAGPAWGTGTLNLFYWDENSFDNTGSIKVDIGAGGVPEPSTWALTILGFGLLGSALRRRRLAYA